MKKNHLIIFLVIETIVLLIGVSLTIAFANYVKTFSNANSFMTLEKAIITLVIVSLISLLAVVAIIITAVKLFKKVRT